LNLISVLFHNQTKNFICAFYTKKLGKKFDFFIVIMINFDDKLTKLTLELIKEKDINERRKIQLQLQNLFDDNDDNEMVSNSLKKKRSLAIQAESVECTTCFSNMTKSNREIVCSFCEHKMCVYCSSKYILEQNNPCCMNCKKEWSRHTLVHDLNFPREFFKKLRDHLQDVYFQAEQSQLPATQRFLESQIEQKQRKQNIVEIKQAIKNLKEELFLMEFEGLDSNHLNDNIMDCARNINKFVLNSSATLSLSSSSSSASEEKTQSRKYYMGCLKNDCRGFIFTDGKCGICNLKICTKCNREKLENHECNKDDVATVKVLKENTKNCPVCREAIFKINGCDQMWCTRCHHAFSWNSGCVIQKNIHNPHYHEYLNKNENTLLRTRGDHYVCGDRLDQYTMGYFTRFFGICDTRTRISYIVQSIQHLVDVQLDKYSPRNDENHKTMLRIRYLQSELSPDQFKKRIQEAIKANQKNSEIYNLCDTFQRVVTEIILRLRQELQDKFPSNMVDMVNPDKKKIDSLEIAEQYFKEVDSIQTYVNDSLELVSKAYDSTLLHVKFYNSKYGYIVETSKVDNAIRDVISSVPRSHKRKLSENEQNEFL
jgi:hypothetical protein